MLLPECPVKICIVRKTDFFVDLAQGDSLKDQRFGSLQSALSHIAVKADAKFLAEGMADGAFADIETDGNILKSNTLIVILFYVSQDVIQ